MANGNMVRVWDPLIRVFHWSLVIAFAVAYFGEAEPLWLHNWAGYLILVLVLVRIVWGFVGTPHARFTDFVQSPWVAGRYILAEMTGRARRYIGHNPAGGLMILALLALLVAQTGTGMVLLAADEGAGPLASWIAPSESLEETLEEVHEILAEGLIVLVVLHIVGVLLGSLRHRENLVRAMIDGRKRDLEP